MRKISNFHIIIKYFRKIKNIKYKYDLRMETIQAFNSWEEGIYGELEKLTDRQFLALRDLHAKEELLNKLKLESSMIIEKENRSWLILICISAIINILIWLI